jgi:hypothetical protein
MLLNTCCTTASFDNQAWMETFREFHRDLKLPDFSSRQPPWPSMFDFYWETVWRKAPETAGAVWLSPQNIREAHKIWEYVQVLYCLKTLLGPMGGRRIVSLGAGVESPLWALARWGAQVTATDIYFEERYWHPEYVPCIRADQTVFCPYENPRPVAFVNLNLKFRRIRDLLCWRRLAPCDALYSISSIEHIHGGHRKRPLTVHRGVLSRKVAMLKRIARKVKAGGAFVFTTEVIVSFTQNRRLDFYTREELELICDALAKEGLRLAEPLDWSALSEQMLPTHDTAGQYHTAVCLAFRRPG